MTILFDGESAFPGKRLGAATAVHGTVALSFVIPSEAEGSAVPRTFLGNAEFAIKQNCHLDRSEA
jgi:hypothetical protein